MVNDSAYLRQKRSKDSDDSLDSNKPLFQSQSISSSTPKRTKKLLKRLFCGAASSTKKTSGKGSRGDGGGGGVSFGLAQTGSFDNDRGYSLAGISHSYSSGSGNGAGTGTGAGAGSENRSRQASPGRSVSTSVTTLLTSNSQSSGRSKSSHSSSQSLSTSDRDAAGSLSGSTSASGKFQSPPRLQRQSLKTVEESQQHSTSNMKTLSPTVQPHMGQFSLLQTSSSEASSRANTPRTTMTPKANLSSTPTANNKAYPYMKSPSAPIPTPSLNIWKILDGRSEDESESGRELFPQSNESGGTTSKSRAMVKDCSGSSQDPRVEVMHISLSHSEAENETDDDSFLPDDFKKDKTYTWNEVQRMIVKAETQIKQQLQSEHQQILGEHQDEAERTLQEYGVQWKHDSDAEYERLNSLLRAEKSKAQKKHMELIDKTTTISELKTRVDLQADEKEELERQVMSLEKQLSGQEGQSPAYVKMLQSKVKSLEEEVEHFRSKSPDITLEEAKKEKDASDQRVEELEYKLYKMQKERSSSDSAPAVDVEELERRHRDELRHLQASKDEANQQVLALQEKLDSLNREVVVSPAQSRELSAAKSRLVAAEQQIADLKNQMESQLQETLKTEIQLDESAKEVIALSKKIDTLKSQNLSQGLLLDARAETDSMKAANERARTEQIATLIEENDDLKHRLGKIEEKYHIELNSPRKKGRESTLEIRALTIECQPSPHGAPAFAEQNDQEKDKLLKTIKIMGENYEKLRDERDVLQEQLETQRKAHTAELESEVKLAKADAQKEVLALKEALEKQQGEFEVQKRRLQTELSAAEIDELTAEVEGLKKRHKLEMDQLRANAATDSESTLQHQERLEQLVADIEKERDVIVENHKMEIAAVKKEMEDMEARHKEEIELVIAKSREEKEQELSSLQSKLANLRIEFEGEKIEIIQTRARENDQLQQQLNEMNKRHALELQRVRREVREEAENEKVLLQGELDLARTKFDREKKSLTESHEKECDSLRERMVELKDEFEKKLDEVKGQARDETDKEIQQLKEELRAAREDGAKQPAATSISDQYLQEMRAKFEEDMDTAKSRAKDDLELLQNAFDDVEMEKEELSKKNRQLEKIVDENEKQRQVDIEKAKEEARAELDKEFRSLEEIIKSMEMGEGSGMNSKGGVDKDEYNRQIRSVQEEHNKEIEELLSQLDLVEAEHNERYREKEKLIKEKDTVISALGSQLAEAQTKLDASTQSQEALANDLGSLHDQLKMARAETEGRNNEIERLLLEHQSAMEHQQLIQEQAVEEAKEQMISRAEVQFEQANETYKKLKVEFDHAVSRISQLEVDLKSSHKDIEDTRKKYESREMDLSNQLAEAKAAIATSDLNAARKIKDYRMELEKSRDMELEIRQKLAEVEATSRSLQSTLAAVVSEKEKLITENTELKAVCEELMELVEANQTNSATGASS